MEEVTPEMRVSYRSSIYFFTGTLIFPSILRRIHLLEYCTIFLYTTILDTAFPMHLGSDMWGSEWEDGFGHGVEFGRILVCFFIFSEQWIRISLAKKERNPITTPITFLLVNHITHSYSSFLWTHERSVSKLRFRYASTRFPTSGYRNIKAIP